jgi:uncharacterized protein (DUF302 family)
MNVQESPGCPVKSFFYTVNTTQSFETAVEAVEQKAAEKGFRVIYTCDVPAKLAYNGHLCGPLTLIEVCHVHDANVALERDVNVALLLPCSIAVFCDNDKIRVSALRPLAILDSSCGPDLLGIARAMEQVIMEIVDEVRSENLKFERTHGPSEAPSG